MGKKKKLSKEDKWVEEMKDQEKTIYKQTHEFSKKEMKIAKKFMDKKHKVEDEAVSLEDEKIFEAEKMKEFNPEEAFKNAKTMEIEDETEGKVVFAPEPKKEKYVHLADDKDYVEKIEIDTHEHKAAPKGTVPDLSGKDLPKKGKGKKPGALKAHRSSEQSSKKGKGKKKK